MKRRTIAFLLLACFVLSSCAALPRVSQEQIAQTSSAETAAAASPTSMPTHTPLPTDTPFPTNTPLPTGTPTPVPSDTPTPTQDRTATAMVQATQEAGEIIARIAPVLAEYELSADDGSLAWVQKKSVSITVDQYGESQYIPIEEGQSFANYALYVDVTWESKSGLAGCGIIFNAKELADGEQYRLMTLRLSGAPAWDIEFWNLNRWQSTTTGNIKFNDAIKLTQSSKNSYLLIMQETLLTIYANGKRLGRVETTKRTRGEIAWLTFQESMETTCTFENAWIWSLE